MAAVPGVEEEIARLDGIAEGCREQAELESPTDAEWHTYELAQEDAKVTIAGHLYHAGFVRVGELDGTLHYEGLPHVLKSRSDDCRRLAERLGLDFRYEPIRQ